MIYPDMRASAACLIHSTSCSQYQFANPLPPTVHQPHVQWLQGCREHTMATAMITPMTTSRSSPHAMRRRVLFWYRFAATSSVVPRCTCSLDCPTYIGMQKKINWYLYCSCICLHIRCPPGPLAVSRCTEPIAVLSRTAFRMHAKEAQIALVTIYAAHLHQLQS